MYIIMLQLDPNQGELANAAHIIDFYKTVLHVMQQKVQAARVSQSDVWITLLEAQGNFPSLSQRRN